MGAGKQIFAFLITFSITFVVGFCAWDNFVCSGKIVLNKFFTASLPNAEQYVEKENIIQKHEPVVEEPVAKEKEVIVRIELTEEERQDLLDDIAEKLDFIQQEINILKAKDEPIELVEKIENKPEEKPIEEPQEQIAEVKQIPAVVSKSSSVWASPVYQTVLISEVLISPIGQRFIELFNPNNIPINLNGWYLQRKTATATNYSSLVSSSYFFNRTIGSNDYFLISRTDENTNFDILYPDLTLSDNNSLAFKNPKGEISDELSFGIIPGNQSFGRTDSNPANFELETPTPKSKNIKWIEPNLVETTSPSIISYTISNSTISPDSDGIKDTTSIDLKFSEKVSYDISIEFGATIIKKWSGNATNPEVKIWDGKNNVGVVVPNGIYTIKIFINKNLVTGVNKTITVEKILTGS